MVFIGILSNLTSAFRSGKGSDIDSKIDSAFLSAGSKASSGAQRNEMISRSPSASAFQKPMQQGARSSVSERVLSGHQKFGEQFSQRPFSEHAAQPAGNFGNSGAESSGRYGDPDEPFAANPIDFNDGLNAQEPPKMPPPLQINREAAEQERFSGESTISPAAPSKFGMPAAQKPLEFPRSGSSVLEKTADYGAGAKIAPSSFDQRMIDEIEDIKAQNNEILRRLQRLEGRIR